MQRKRSEPIPEWARRELDEILSKIELADDGIDPYEEPPTNEGEAADRLIPYDELTNARARLFVLLVKDDLAQQIRSEDAKPEAV